MAVFRAGSGSVSLTNGSGSGRPKNIWILRIRIRTRNTAGIWGLVWFQGSEDACTGPTWSRPSWRKSSRTTARAFSHSRSGAEALSSSETTTDAGQKRAAFLLEIVNLVKDIVQPKLRGVKRGTIRTVLTTAKKAFSHSRSGVETLSSSEATTDAGQRRVAFLLEIVYLAR